MALDTEQASVPPFPSWPLNCLTFYSRLAADYGRYAQALGNAAAHPAQAIRIEEDYGASLLRDVMQAWYDLALSPLSAMVKLTAGVAPAPDAAPQADAVVRGLT